MTAGEPDSAPLFAVSAGARDSVQRGRCLHLNADVRCRLRPLHAISAPPPAGIFCSSGFESLIVAQHNARPGSSGQFPETLSQRGFLALSPEQALLLHALNCTLGPAGALQRSPWGSYAEVLSSLCPCPRLGGHAHCAGLSPSWEGSDATQTWHGRKPQTGKCRAKPGSSGHPIAEPGSWRQAVALGHF